MWQEQFCSKFLPLESWWAITGGANHATSLYFSVHRSMKCLDPEDIAASVIHVLSAPAYCGIHDVTLLPVEQDLSGAGAWWVCRCTGVMVLRNLSFDRPQASEFRTLCNHWCCEASGLLVLQVGPVLRGLGCLGSEVSENRYTWNNGFSFACCSCLLHSCT